jgi:hypothetical protein
VQHVSTEDGRAIVGNVTQDVPGSASQKSAARPLALTNFRQQPMRFIEERRKGELVLARRRQKNEIMGKLGVKNEPLCRRQNIAARMGDCNDVRGCND